MFIASHYHIIVSYVDISSGGGSTQKADSVEGHLKLWTGANESTSNWLYLHKRTIKMYNVTLLLCHSNHHPSNSGLVCWNTKAL